MKQHFNIRCLTDACLTLINTSAPGSIPAPSTGLFWTAGRRMGSVLTLEIVSDKRPEPVYVWLVPEKWDGSQKTGGVLVSINEWMIESSKSCNLQNVMHTAIQFSILKTLWHFGKLACLSNPDYEDIIWAPGCVQPHCMEVIEINLCEVAWGQGWLCLWKLSRINVSNYIRVQKTCLMRSAPVPIRQNGSVQH